MNGSTVEAQLESYFGTSDLLQVIGIKNREAYINAPNDPFTARQAYLRSVLRVHPDSSCISSTNPEQYEEYLERCKKIFIFRDIYLFLTSEDEEVAKARARYLDKGEFPQLISLEILSDHDKCRKKFGLPPFEAVAGELKEIYAVQMRRIKEIQGEDFQI